jgi:hypothetical protein
MARSAQGRLREIRAGGDCGDFRKKLAKAGFLFLKNARDFPLPERYEWRFIRQFVADETGWTLADVDAMSMQDYIDWQAYREAKIKAQPPQKQPTVPRRPRSRGRR